MYKISEFAKKIGRSTSTVRRWETEGKIKPNRSISGQRYFSDSDIRLVLSQPSGKKKTIVYCRVSNSSQKDDLKNQIKSLEQYCLSDALLVDEWVSEVGSGMDFKRKKFLKLISDMISGDVSKIVIAHKDSLMRFGFDLFAHIASLSGCELVVVNQQSLSPQEEVVQDLMAIIHVFSCRLYGLRKYKKKIKNAIT